MEPKEPSEMALHLPQVFFAVCGVCWSCAVLFSPHGVDPKKVELEDICQKGHAMVKLGPALSMMS